MANEAEPGGEDRPVENRIDHERVKTIIQRRLARVPPSRRAYFPAVLSRDPINWAIIPGAGFLLVAFLSEQEENRIQDLIERGFDPFPGLITQDPDARSAFSMENSRNIVLQHTEVENAYSISLGPDSTIILQEHRQIITTNELGRYEYTVALAYLISYGDEIYPSSVYDYLEDLIAYSISLWKLDHAH